jgi:(2Fe-2S) ferredoxin
MHADLSPLQEKAPVLGAALTQHIVVCTGKSCSSFNSEAVLEAFWACLADRGVLYGKRGSWEGRVLVSTGGSIGLCQIGPAVMVYPEGVWYAGVTPADVPEIVDQHILGGQPVARLQVYQWPQA